VGDGLKFVYKVGYGSPEDSECAELTNDAPLDPVQLKYVIHKAVISVLEDIISGKIIDVYLHENGPSYGELHKHVVQKLIDEHGFEPVTYDGEWSCFGWPSVTDESDWKGQRDHDLELLCKVIPEDIKDEINRIAILQKMYDDHLWKKHDL
jgi:hypothetical protein